MGLSGVIAIRRADGELAPVEVELVEQHGPADRPGAARVFELVVPVELDEGEALVSGPELRAGDELRWQVAPPPWWRSGCGRR